MEAAAERDGGVCCETDVRKLDLIPPPHTHTLGSRRGSEETAEVAKTRRLRVLGGRFFSSSQCRRKRLSAAPASLLLLRCRTHTQLPLFIRTKLRVATCAQEDMEWTR